ncbi:LBP/BPI3.2 [Biomphalaria glabrata]
MCVSKPSDQILYHVLTYKVIKVQPVLTSSVSFITYVLCCLKGETTMATSLFYLVIAVAIIPTLSQNPGVKMRVTQNGIDYAEKVAKSALTEKLNNIRLEDVSGKDGKFEYWLKNFRLENVAIPDIDMSFNPGQRGLTMNLRNLGVDVLLDYRVRYKLLFVPISNSGGVSVNFRGVEMTATVGIDQFEDTSPRLVSRSCSAAIGDFNINFSGSMAWLLNLLKGLFRGKIRDTIRSKVSGCCFRDSLMNVSSFLNSRLDSPASIV